jgi:aspartyl-tRNA(Asn)/glutamyl-tRNA(Gln) amidotransferase subunit A
MGPLTLGTDGGGSIRIPCAFTGLFGLKPSFGRVPVHPPYLGRVAGPMTRSVADAALLLNVVAQPDGRDFMSLPREERDFTSGLETLEPRGLKIGFLPDMGVGLKVTAEVRAAADGAATALAAAGCSVESIRSFLTDEMLDGICRFFEARSYNDLAQLPAARRHKVLPFIAEWCSWRAAGFSGRDVMQAYAQVMAMCEAAVLAAQPYDFLLSPTSPILAYEAELPAPGNDPRDALPHIAFTVPYNMSGQPAVSINCGYTAKNHPIGLQIAGRRFDDVGVLRLAAAFERIRPAQLPWP